PVRALDAGVSEVRREGNDVALDSIAADRATFQRSHREGVTKIVNSRVLSEGVLLDAGPRSHFAEHRFDLVLRERSEAARHEDGLRLRDDATACSKVRSEGRSCARVQWQEPRLAELRLANHQPISAHVREAKGDDLRQAHPRGYDETVQRAVGLPQE